MTFLLTRMHIVIGIPLYPTIFRKKAKHMIPQELFSYHGLRTHVLHRISVDFDQAMTSSPRLDMTTIPTMHLDDSRKQSQQRSEPYLRDEEEPNRLDRENMNTPPSASHPKLHPPHRVITTSHQGKSVHGPLSSPIKDPQIFDIPIHASNKAEYHNLISLTS